MTSDQCKGYGKYALETVGDQTEEHLQGVLARLDSRISNGAFKECNMGSFVLSNLSESLAGPNWQTSVDKCLLIEFGECSRVERVLQMLQRKCVLEDISVYNDEVSNDGERHDKFTYQKELSWRELP